MFKSSENSEKSGTVVDFRATSASSLTAADIELEENVLGAVLLDPEAIGLVEGLPVEAFQISAHKRIWRLMVQLHSKGLKPDLLTVEFKLTELGILKDIGGKAKLAQLVDRCVHSFYIEQHARLLQEKYERRAVSEGLAKLPQILAAGGNIGEVIQSAQKQLEWVKLRQSVTGDTSARGDTPNLDPARLSSTVTSVTQTLEKGLPEWEEQAKLDAIQAQSGLSRTSFSHLVASRRCQLDEVQSEDLLRFNQLTAWDNMELDFHKVLPGWADDLLQAAGVLNIDPISLWQYLLPAAISLIGKKADLDVESHQIPAIAWTCIVGESGTGKTRAEKVILAPLKGWQGIEYERFRKEWEAYKAGKNSEEPPEKPIPERKYLFEVATIQAVMRRLTEQGDNGSLWARDEIAGLFKSLGQFSKSGDHEGLECLLRMWDGEGIQTDRVLHEDSYFVPSTRLSIAGGIQPGIYRKNYADPDDANGMQARFLFAIAKVQPARRVKGYCRLSDILPDFYQWIEQKFPEGRIKLSRAADKRYDRLYEQIGKQAEQGSTPAIRTWLRKLPRHLLTITFSLHILECYKEPGRPRHEIQLDTLERAVELARYYRATFECLQEKISESDDTSSILLKIWDLAATSPVGITVRDIYRQVKVIQRRAKELGRNVAAYTMELCSQLEIAGRGYLQKAGRLVRFVVGESEPIKSVTVVTQPQTDSEPGLQVSPSEEVSPVTEHLDHCKLLTDEELAEWRTKAEDCQYQEDFFQLHEQLMQTWSEAQYEQFIAWWSEYFLYFEHLPERPQPAQLDLQPTTKSTESTEQQFSDLTSNPEKSTSLAAVSASAEESAVESVVAKNHEKLPERPPEPQPQMESQPQLPPSPKPLIIFGCMTWAELLEAVDAAAASTSVSREQIFLRAIQSLTQNERRQLPQLLAIHMKQFPGDSSIWDWLPKSLTKLKVKALELVEASEVFSPTDSLGMPAALNPD